jgi:hypothetical protein
MSIKQDVKSIVSNTVTAPLSLGATTLKLAADGTGLIDSGARATPAVLKALLTLPFATAKGYIKEAEGVSDEVAELRAYHYIKQDLSTTIEEVGVGSGKLLAELLKEDDLDAALVSKESLVKLSRSELADMVLAK